MPALQPVIMALSGADMIQSLSFIKVPPLPVALYGLAAALAVATPEPLD